MKISRALRSVVGICAAVLTACGDTGPGAGTSSAGSSSASSGSAGTDSATSMGTNGTASAGSSGGGTASSTGTSSASGSGSGTSGSGSSTSGASMSSTGSTGSSGGSSTASSSSSGSSSGGSSGGSTGGGGMYFAFALIGGLDRVIVRHAADGLCTELRLVYPANMGSLPISTPMGWSVEGASIHDGLADCLTTNALATTAVWATGGSGSVSWAPMMQLYPCQLDVDVTLDFAMPPAWAPSSTALLAADLPVSGC